MSDLDLARRLVACPRWPRFRADGSYRTLRGKLTYREHDTGRLWVDVGAMSHDWLPDLDDAATVGCVEALVREVHQRPDAYVRRCGQRWGDAAPLWGVYGLAEHMHELADKTVAPTRAAALVAALEAP